MTKKAQAAANTLIQTFLGLVPYQPIPQRRKTTPADELTPFYKSAQITSEDVEKFKTSLDMFTGNLEFTNPKMQGVPENFEFPRPEVTPFANKILNQRRSLFSIYKPITRKSATTPELSKYEKIFGNSRFNKLTIDDLLPSDLQTMQLKAIVNNLGDPIKTQLGLTPNKSNYDLVLNQQIARLSDLLIFPNRGPNILSHYIKTNPSKLLLDYSDGLKIESDSRIANKPFDWKSFYTNRGYTNIAAPKTPVYQEDKGQTNPGVTPGNKKDDGINLQFGGFRHNP